jgi:hypothetical protein
MRPKIIDSDRNDPGITSVEMLSSVKSRKRSKATGRALLYSLLLSLLAVSFAMNIFANYGALTDSVKYNDGSVLAEYHTFASEDYSLLDHTFLIAWLSGTLSELGFNAFMINLMFATAGTWPIFLLSGLLPDSRKTLFLLLSLAPSFLIFRSFTGKEAIATCFLGFALYYLYCFAVERGARYQLVLVAFLLFLYFLFRPTFAVYVAIFVIYVAAYVYVENKPVARRNAASFNLPFFVFFIWGLVFIPSLTYYIFWEIAGRTHLFINEDSAELSRAGFFDPTDDRNLVDNLWWAVPFGFFGALPSEVIIKPLLLILVLPNLLALLYALISCFSLLCKSRRGNLNLVIITFLVCICPGILISSAPLTAIHAQFGFRYTSGYYLFVIWVPFFFYLLHRKRN